MKTQKELFNELREKLAQGIVPFKYRKISDGSVREARGTLNFNQIPVEKYPSGMPTPQANKHQKYFDVDSDGWRSIAGEILEVGEVEPMVEE